jgi:predicted nucleotidyltransferase component of viral defense system
MISRNELLAVANATGLTANVVEKDYVLGWLLRGISQHEELRDRWIFKGGTCLKKCYFETYRFSEDLDFTLLRPSHIDAEYLQAALAEVGTRVYEESGIEMPGDLLRFEVYENPRGNPSCQGRVYYRSQFQSGNNFPAVKLDLTADEILIDEGVWRPVSHPYSDQPSGGVEALCYSYEELFGEKLRALGERTRARDLYDVINLHRNSQYSPDPARVLDVLTRKCAFKKIALITLDIVAAARDSVVGTWEGMLRHQLPQLPPFAVFWDALPAVFEWLNSNMPVPTSTPVRVAMGEEVLQPRFGGLAQVGGRASVLELIRFAAQNRQVVELDYTNDKGARHPRIIEPYSLRRSRAGAVSLAAHDIEAGHIKYYRVDRILGAQALDRVFVPRHTIELTPASAPVASPMRQAPGQRRTSFSRGGTYGNARRTKYIVQCHYCNRRFPRATRTLTLKPHLTRDGYRCSGRRGTIVEVR